MTLHDVRTHALLGLRAALLAGLATLAGCLGSPNPYRPGFEPRPEEVPLETAEAEAKRMAVPIEALRNDAYFTYTRKELGRILSDIPPQPWNTYAVDMKHTLPADLVARYVPKDPRGDAAAAGASGGDEEASEDGEGEGGDED